MLSKAPRRSFLSKVPSLLMSINLKQSSTSGSDLRRILLLRLHSVPCPSCLCELLLPGLKRELKNTPPGERGQLLKELAEAQRCLGGDGIPKPRVFAVSRQCDSEQGVEA